MGTARKSKGSAKRTSASGGGLSDALGQAAWAEADATLAEAIREFGELKQAVAGLKGPPAAKARADEAMALMEQALARLGRRRNLTRIGEIGAVTPFEPQEHELAQASSSPPKHVMVVAEGVRRGAHVLLPALVKAVRSPRKNTRR